jgi:hypothetical protein
MGRSPLRSAARRRGVETGELGLQQGQGQRPGTQHRSQGKKRDSMFDNLMDIFDF